MQAPAQCQAPANDTGTTFRARGSELHRFALKIIITHVCGALRLSKPFLSIPSLEPHDDPVFYF